MSDTKTGGPAFPTQTDFTYQHGMTLRDYFAAKAMQSLVREEEWVAGDLCQQAYHIADVMLKARKL